ncbi:MAG: class I SAM-dependent methyltransferase [Phycisphaerae bacterium]|jgi:SAM-dependent methyltransferase
MNAEAGSGPSSPAGIPPLVYDIAFGWDTTPEVQRLLFACRTCGRSPASALELGCGTGRLLRGLEAHMSDLAGIDLSAEMVAYARQRTSATLAVGNMSALALGRRFDLVYTSANTLRCVTAPTAIEGLWRGIAEHLTPGGLFVADLEVGFDAEAEKVGRPVSWTLSRDETSVRVTWTVLAGPTPAERCSRIEWVFEVQQGEPAGTWREAFTLRTYDAEELLALAAAGGELSPRGLYLLRDPYLFETPAAEAVGRFLVVLQCSGA